MFPFHRVTWIRTSEWRETGLLRGGQWPGDTERQRALLLYFMTGTTELAWSTHAPAGQKFLEVPGEHQALSRAQGPLGSLSLLTHDKINIFMHESSSVLYTLFHGF